MPSKKFRCDKFYPGDLVRHDRDTYFDIYRHGIVMELNYGIYPTIKVMWQNGKIINEHEMDIKLVD